MPLRAVVPVFAVTAKVTAPLPLPLSPLMIVSQATLLVASHGHPAPAVTAIGAPVPPAAAMDTPVGA